MAIAGKVMPLPRGDYMPEEVYNILDIVGHNEKPWMCKKNGTVGIEPSLSNPDYWMLLIDVDITNADTLDEHDSAYFLSKDELADAFETKQIVFRAASWVGEQAPYTQTIELAGIKASDEPVAFFVDDGDTEANSNAKKKACSFISYFDSADGSITATCKYKKPEVDFTVGLKGVFPKYEVLSE